MKSLSHVQLFATPWTAAYQAPPSMGFSRQEYWSGVPLPSLLLQKKKKKKEEEEEETNSIKHSNVEFRKNGKEWDWFTRTFTGRLKLSQSWRWQQKLWDNIYCVWSNKSLKKILRVGKKKKCLLGLGSYWLVWGQGEDFFCVKAISWDFHPDNKSLCREHNSPSRGGKIMINVSSCLHE